MTHSLIGKHVRVVVCRAGDLDSSGQPRAEDVAHTGVLLRASYDGEADLDVGDGVTLYVWPALVITEEPQ